MTDPWFEHQLVLIVRWLEETIYAYRILIWGVSEDVQN